MNDTEHYESSFDQLRLVEIEPQPDFDDRDDDDGNIIPITNGKRARRSKTPHEHDPNDGPVIRVLAGKIHLAATAAEEALSSSGAKVYQRGISLVRPAVREVPAAKGRTTIAATLHELSGASLIDELSGCAVFEKWDARADAFVRINPPALVADVMLSRVGRWNLPVVAGIITCPTLRGDGSVLSAPGYDSATRLFHAADLTLRLSSAVHNPTRKAAEAALGCLAGLLREFPLVNEVSKAVALSGLITPVVRGALQVVPMHAFRASTAGTGKSYLVDTASAISAGRPCPVASVAADDAETDKRLTGLLLSGFPLISLDNVNGEIGGDLLAQAIERPLIQLRRLGTSDITEIESKSTVYATGNNLRVSGDMTRRTVVCDLDAGVERPELRQFRADPVATVMADRGRYVSACLIVVRAYQLAGHPNLLPPIASFSDWSNQVRSALVWLGCADPAASMEIAREDDPELTELREIVALWRAAAPAGHGSMTSKQLADLADGKAYDEARGMVDYEWPDLRELFLRIAGDRGVISATRLGLRLRKHRGRIVGGWRIERDAVSAGPVARWMLSSASKTA